MKSTSCCGSRSCGSSEAGQSRGKHGDTAVLFSALSVDQARYAGKEKAHEHSQTHRLRHHVCRAACTYGGTAPADGIVLRDWSGGQRQVRKRIGCRGVGIPASHLSRGRWLLSPQCAPYAGVLRDLRGIPRNHAFGDVPRLDVECGDFRGVRRQRRTGVVCPSRTAFWMEKNEIIGIDQNAGMAKFYSRRASDFLLYW